MGNLIQRSGRRTHPSVPQENGERDAIQEASLQTTRSHATCIWEWLQDHYPKAFKGGSTTTSFLANELQVEHVDDCELYCDVDSETRGQKKCIRFLQQPCGFPATMNGMACFLVNRYPLIEHSKTLFPKRRPKRWVQVHHHCTSNILHECVRLQAAHLIPYLVHDGIDIDETDALGLSALHLASKTLKKEAIQMLLRYGANINLTVPTTGRSALHFATQYSSSKAGITLGAGRECVELLLRHGAEVCMRDRIGKEAIHFACQGGRGDLVTLLLDYGADINALTSLQESPLFLFLEEKTNLRQATLLDKLLGLSYPLKITNSEDRLPRGLNSPCDAQLKDALLRMTSEVLPLQDICKFYVRKIYGENMKYWLESKLPTSLWKSIYMDQEFSYASKIRAFR